MSLPYDQHMDRIRERGETLSQPSDPIDTSLVLPRGLKLAYREWGGNGLPIVLVHGLASSYRIWDLVAPRLAVRHRVVALDQRGHGRSDRPDDSFDFATYVADLRGFMDALGLEQAILVGHSWGGNVVVQFGFDHPDRAPGLVLVDGGFIEPSARPGWTWEQAQQQMAPPELDGISREELLERVQSGPLGPVWSPERDEMLLGHFEPLPDGRVRPWLRRAHHMEIVRALWEHRPSQLWAQLQQPVLLIPARLAEIPSERVERQVAREQAVADAVANLPRSELLWMEDTVHDIPVQRPVELADAILRFSEGVAQG
jgi:pimeloyl-ACP methyl ester carboxylesterase